MRLSLVNSTVVFLSMILFLGGCGRKNGHSQLLQNDLNPSVGKRGVALNSIAHGKVLAQTGKVKWFYNWASNADHIPNMEYVPMIWGTKDFNKNPKPSRYILGFNEPNFCEQANMTPEEAARHWKNSFQAKASGRQTISPAVNFSPGLGRCGKSGANTKNGVDYLKAFFAACQGCKVDYIAVHSYTCTANQAIGHLKQYISAFPDKKIWLTEFASDCGGNGSSVQQQMEYMKGMLSYLDSEPAIYRYAWFKAHFSSSGGYRYKTASLVGDNMQLTELGKIYTGSEGGSSHGGGSSGGTPQQTSPVIDMHDERWHPSCQTYMKESLVRHARGSEAVKGMAWNRIPHDWQACVESYQNGGYVGAQPSGHQPIVSHIPQETHTPVADIHSEKWHPSCQPYMKEALVKHARGSEEVKGMFWNRVPDDWQACVESYQKGGYVGAQPSGHQPTVPHIPQETHTPNADIHSEKWHPSCQPYMKEALVKHERGSEEVKGMFWNKEPHDWQSCVGSYQQGGYHGEAHVPQAHHGSWHHTCEPYMIDALKKYPRHAKEVEGMRWNTDPVYWRSCVEHYQNGHGGSPAHQ